MGVGTADLKAKLHTRLRFGDSSVQFLTLHLSDFCALKFAIYGGHAEAKLQQRLRFGDTFARFLTLCASDFCAQKSAI